MYLTATLKLHLGNHDRALLHTAMSRWSHVLWMALETAKDRDRELLRCLVPYTSKKGHTSLVVDQERFQTIVKECCGSHPTSLHSSARATLIVVVGGMLSSWLELYRDYLRERKLWKERDSEQITKDKKARRCPPIRPRFPTLPPGSPRQGERRRIAALEAARSVGTNGNPEGSLEEENRWRADLLRAARGRICPLTFGAASAGALNKQGQPYLHHCGLIRRDDGKLFAYLALWGAGSPLGEPVKRARNREQRGDLRNLREQEVFSPTERQRAGIMVPLEFCEGHETLFFSRAIPKSAQIVRRDDEYYLHVAFAYVDHPTVETSNILAIRRGIDTLVSGVVIDRQGNPIQYLQFEGKTLHTIVDQIQKNRAVRQAKGNLLKGDRQQARIVEHHLYQLCHTIRDIARQWEAEIVFLADSRSQQPQRMLAYRHFSRMHDIMGYLALEARLPAPIERSIFGPGSWGTCPACGWTRGDRPNHTDVTGKACPGCRRSRRTEWDLSTLLAYDVLRYRQHPERESRPTLGEFIRTLDRKKDP